MHCRLFLNKHTLPLPPCLPPEMSKYRRVDTIVASAVFGEFSPVIDEDEAYTVVDLSEHMEKKLHPVGCAKDMRMPQWRQFRAGKHNAIGEAALYYKKYQGHGIVLSVDLFAKGTKEYEESPQAKNYIVTTVDFYIERLLKAHREHENSFVRCFSEVILHGHPCHLHFDIDVDREANPALDCKRLFNCLEETIRECLDLMLGIKECSFHVMDSSDMRKLSWHVIVKCHRVDWRFVARMRMNSEWFVPYTKAADAQGYKKPSDAKKERAAEKKRAKSRPQKIRKKQNIWGGGRSIDGDDDDQPPDDFLAGFCPEYFRVDDGNDDDDDDDGDDDGNSPAPGLFMFENNYHCGAFMRHLCNFALLKYGTNLRANPLFVSSPLRKVNVDGEVREWQGMIFACDPVIYTADRVFRLGVNCKKGDNRYLIARPVDYFRQGLTEQVLRTGHGCTEKDIVWDEDSFRRDVFQHMIQFEHPKNCKKVGILRMRDPDGSIPISMALQKFVSVSHGGVLEALTAETACSFVVAKEIISRTKNTTPLGSSAPKFVSLDEESVSLSLLLGGSGSLSHGRKDSSKPGTFYPRRNLFEKAAGGCLAATPPTLARDLSRLVDAWASICTRVLREAGYTQKIVGSDRIRIEAKKPYCDYRGGGRENMHKGNHGYWDIVFDYTFLYSDDEDRPVDGVFYFTRCYDSTCVQADPERAKKQIIPRRVVEKAGGYEFIRQLAGGIHMRTPCDGRSTMKTLLALEGLCVSQRQEQEQQ